jgi:hypothetical protein
MVMAVGEWLVRKSYLLAVVKNRFSPQAKVAQCVL